MKETIRWRDILIVILACTIIALVTYIKIIVNKTPEPLIKREVIEKLQVIERVIIAKAHQKGIASWYGEPEHGQQTASGEIYNMYNMTAAHPTLPFGTKLLITNLRNGKSVIVEVTDRLPKVWTKPKYGRVIDMSYGSAKKIDMVADGIVPVDVKILEIYHDREGD